MIKILLADDHHIFREGLKALIAKAPGIEVVDEASHGKEVLRKIRQNDYDLVLLDLSMPGGNGLDTLKQIKSEKPELNILILTMYPEEQYAIRTLKAGASGYLTKRTVSHEMLDAIRKVAGGGRYITTSLADRLVTHLGMDFSVPLHERLSDREYQVMCMIAAGKSLSMIAEELFLSKKTISTYRERILEKMNMKGNADLVRYALEHNLIQ